ncbi:hypothetical protein DRN74_01970 [Candidatus Micrarchaeota archaeon]|nr:MAG: hypothetical protein DRN74_01970 [Candidatus Micrarchaeota archaeon]
MDWKRIRKLLFGKKKQNVSDEIKDWVVSFIVAAVIYFVIMPAVFNSPSPAVVVSSCSEKGNLNIGDIIFVAGVDVKDVRAPMVNLNSSSKIKPIVNDSFFVNEMLFGDKLIRFNNSNDIVVYNSRPYNYQIIHHAFAILNLSSKYYLVTKGSANAIPDQIGKNGVFCLTENPGTCLSTAVDDNMLLGRKVLFTIPLLGHIKLFLCDLTFNKLCEGHANAGTDYYYVLSC